MHIYELHYLEQLPPCVMSSWEHIGSNRKNGIINVTDMKTEKPLLFYGDNK